MRFLRETFRIDSMLLTMIGGAVIGCIVQFADYHTTAHGPMRAFAVASIAGGLAGLVGGCAGRAIGLAVCRGRKDAAIPRWIGNFVAFVSAVAIVPVFAQA